MSIDAIAAPAAGAPDDIAAACAELAIFVSDTLSGIWLERDWDDDAVRTLISRAANTRGVPESALRLQVALRMVRDPELLEYPPAVAMAAQLRRLLVVGSFDHVSLWVRGAGGAATRVAGVGAGDEPAAAERLAAHMIEPGEWRPDEPGCRDAHMVATPVVRWQKRHAALVGRAADPADRRRCHILLGEATGIMAALLERQALLQRNDGKERALVEASERGLERVGLDLHDRPVQDLACLVDDVRLFRAQVGSVLKGQPEADILMGRTDDLQARMEAVHTQLRELSHGLVAPMAFQRPLPDLLRSEARTFRTLTDVDLDLRLEGDLEGLTASQRIALTRIVQEALANIREHAAASWARVVVRGLATHIEAVIENDGRGFDVAHVVADAARRGRIGLVGMTERARLLGGNCHIASAPGAHTRVEVSLPRWNQAARAAAPPNHASARSKRSRAAR